MSDYLPSSGPQPTRPTMRITPFLSSFSRQMIPGLIGLFLFVAGIDRVSFGQSGMPRPLVVFTEESLGRKPLNSYGSLEGSIQAMRAYRPLDLNAEAWKKANPGRRHLEWAEEARECLRRGLHYDLPPVDLKSKTLRGWKPTHSSARRSNSTRRPGSECPDISTFRRTSRSLLLPCSSCTSGAARCSLARIGSAVNPCIPS